MSLLTFLVDHWQPRRYVAAVIALTALMLTVPSAGPAMAQGWGYYPAYAQHHCLGKPIAWVAYPLMAVGLCRQGFGVRSYRDPLADAVNSCVNLGPPPRC